MGKRGQELRRKNNATIQDAFARLIKTKDEVIEAGMYDVLENAVHVALAAHNETHQSHIQIGDTYGWMLVHNHRIVEISVVATDDNRGNATKQLRAKLRELPKTGWIGVVMAGMQPASYFSVTYELGTLEYARTATLLNFFQFFKPI
jgi:hypothetical protein